MYNSQRGPVATDSVVMQHYLLIDCLDVIFTGFWIQGRQKPLFARRKLLERQRIIVQVRCVVYVPVTQEEVL